MYIDEEEIAALARQSGYFWVHEGHPEMERNQGIWDAAEQELIELHLQTIFDMHSEALMALKNEPDAEEACWMMMRYWEVEYDDCIYADETWYLGDWEVRFCDGQWLFESGEDNFLDYSLLSGCREAAFQYESVESRLMLFMKEVKMTRAQKYLLAKLLVSAENYFRSEYES